MLSFGETRELHLGVANSENPKKTDTLHVIPFRDGDMFIQGPETNRLMKHAIVPVKNETLI
jgi:hypothetical protein